jgi:myo-inositol-1(or 4)-monophosphatase
VREPPSLDLAVSVAQEAGELLSRYAADRRDGLDLDVATKTSATDPVSEADRAAERLIADRLLAARPDDGLLGEEGQASREGSSGVRWVVDPLDGTVNFLYDRPTWCVSIAAEDGAGGLVGVVHAPVLGETWTATRGGGAHLHRSVGPPTTVGPRAGRRLAVSAVLDLASTLVATGFAYDPAVRSDQGRLVAALLGHVRDVRRGGSAALDLAWAAAGRHDAYLEFGLSPWDWAAGELLVREAGGAVSRVRGVFGGELLTGLVAGGEVAHGALRAWLDPRL